MKEGVGMDVFLSDINFMVFKKWVFIELSRDYKVEENKKKVVFSAQKSHGSVTFNDMNIIEMEVTRDRDERVEFYLHFEMTTMKHAVSLFEDMLKVIKKIEERTTIKVLLSCTSGLTTTFFAETLNDAVQMLGEDLSFEAVAFTELYQAGYDYDVILLAPQIAYNLPKVKQALTNQFVLPLPAEYFATYDVQNTINLIKKELKNKKRKQTQKLNIDISTVIKSKGKYLICGFIRHRSHMFIAYRVYDHNEILLENEMVYPITTQDGPHSKADDFNYNMIIDILKPIMIQYPDIKSIGISMPMMIKNERYMMLEPDWYNIDMKTRIENELHAPTYLYNENNATLVGIHAAQPSDNMALFYVGKGRYTGGTALIIDNKLVVGYNGVAGEIHYNTYNHIFDRFKELSGSPEGCAEIAAVRALELMTIAGPEVIAIYSKMVMDIKDVRTILAEYLDEEVMPKLIKIPHAKDYMLVGTYILTANR